MRQCMGERGLLLSVEAMDYEHATYLNMAITLQSRGLTISLHPLPGTARVCDSNPGLSSIHRPPISLVAPGAAIECRKTRKSYSTSR